MMHNPRFSSNSDPRSIHRLERKKKEENLVAFTSFARIPSPFSS